MAHKGFFSKANIMSLYNDIFPGGLRYWERQGWVVPNEQGLYTQAQVDTIGQAWQLMRKKGYSPSDAFKEVLGADYKESVNG